MHVLRLREPVSALTHLLGALLAVAGLVVLVWRGAVHGTAWHVVAYTVFGVSMVLLYTASTLYHALPVGPRAIRTLRRIDHIMIFFLIAGTYTPFCLLPLRGPWGWSLFGAIWGCTVAGMTIKVLWLNAPRWLSTGVYLLMGWLAVIALAPLMQTASRISVAWLIGGGLLYSVGAVFYATRWPNPWPGKFGFHEIWHLFVMAGTGAHFLAVLLLI